MIDKYETGGVPYAQRDRLISCPRCGAVWVGSTTRLCGLCSLTEQQEQENDKQNAPNI